MTTAETRSDPEARRVIRRGIFDAERAFRRGYHQAVIAVLDALESGKDPDLGDFERRVKAWRERPAFPINPPAIFE